MPRSLICCLAVVLAPLAAGQYSSDSSVNLELSAAASDQNQPKLSATEDGGTWVSWFDGIGTGWDVRIQRLDAAGNEVFPSGGLLVADRAYSSTQDYDLATAANGDALLAYRNNPGGGDEIEVARVSTGGGVLWTTTVAAAAGFVAAPSVTGTGNEQAVVGWTENASVRFQGLDQAGNPTWGLGTLITPGTGTYSVGNVVAAPQAGAIASIIHQTGGFGSPRLLLAQRFNSLGAPVWGASPVTVFGSGSLQFGAFPECQSFDDGTSLFAWYSSSPSLQCFVQRLDAQGQALFTPGGLAVSTNTSRSRTAPAAFLGADLHVYAYWRELSANQVESGIYGQRIAANGTRVWGAEGVELVPLSTQTVSQVGAVPGLSLSSSAGIVSWVTTLTFGDDRVRAMLISPTGQISAGPVNVSAAASGKSRLASERTAAPFSNRGVMAWSDSRSDGGDIYVQDVSLGAALGVELPLGMLAAGCSTTATSTGNPAALLAFGSAVIADGALDLRATLLPPSQFGYFVTSPDTDFIPFAGGSQGNLCLGGFIGRLNAPGQVLFSGQSGEASLQVSLATLPFAGGTGSVLSGSTQYFQGWFRDVNPMPTSNFTNAVGVQGL